MKYLTIRVILIKEKKRKENKNNKLKLGVDIMNGYCYSIELVTEIGVRNGKLFLSNDNNNQENFGIGWIDILSGREEIFCQWQNKQLCTISGKIKSLKKEIPFNAQCVLKENFIYMDIQLKNKNLYATGKVSNDE